MRIADHLARTSRLGLERVRPIRGSESPAYETQFEVSERALSMRGCVVPCLFLLYRMFSLVGVVFLQVVVDVV